VTTTGRRSAWYRRDFLHTAAPTATYAIAIRNDRLTSTPAGRSGGHSIRFLQGRTGVYRQDFEDMGHCQTIRSSVRALRNSIRTLGNHAQLGNGVANDGDKDSQRA
jgi:hypothetical protein